MSHPAFYAFKTSIIRQPIISSVCNITDDFCQKIYIEGEWVLNYANYDSKFTYHVTDLKWLHVCTVK